MQSRPVGFSGASNIHCMQDPPSVVEVVKKKPQGINTPTFHADKEDSPQESHATPSKSRAHKSFLMLFACIISDECVRLVLTRVRDSWPSLGMNGPFTCLLQTINKDKLEQRGCIPVMWINTTEIQRNPFEFESVTSGWYPRLSGTKFALSNKTWQQC